MTPGLLGTSGSILLAGLVAASAAPAATFTVTNTNDANAGSLRQAITDANAAAEPTRLRSTSRARARLRLRAAGVHGRLPGRPLSVHVREWDRAARHREQITGGCGGGNYCPLNNNTRGQMAVFITKTFHLQ